MAEQRRGRAGSAPPGPSGAWDGRPAPSATESLQVARDVAAATTKATLDRSYVAEQARALGLKAPKAFERLLEEQPGLAAEMLAEVSRDSRADPDVDYTPERIDEFMEQAAGADFDPDVYADRLAAVTPAAFAKNWTYMYAPVLKDGPWKGRCPRKTLVPNVTAGDYRLLAGWTLTLPKGVEMIPEPEIVCGIATLMGGVCTYAVHAPEHLVLHQEAKHPRELANRRQYQEDQDRRRAEERHTEEMADRRRALLLQERQLALVERQVALAERGISTPGGSTDEITQ